MAEIPYLGTVAELRLVLWPEAWKARGGWVHRTLPGGLLVALRVRPEDFRHEFRLARQGDLTTASDRAFWREQVDQVRHDLECESWGARAHPTKAVLLLTEPETFASVRQPAAPEGVPCADCGTLTPYEPAYTRQRCTSCAIKAGKDAP